MKYIDPGGAKRHDWIAYSAEWTPDSRTVVGQFAKKFYRPRINIKKGTLPFMGKRVASPFWNDELDLIRDSLVFEAFFVWLVDAGFMGDLAQGVRNRLKVKWARFKLKAANRGEARNY